MVSELRKFMIDNDVETLKELIPALEKLELLQDVERMRIEGMLRMLASDVGPEIVDIVELDVLIDRLSGLVRYGTILKNNPKFGFCKVEDLPEGVSVDDLIGPLDIVSE